MNLLKSLSIYGVSSVLNAGLPFFLLPVLTAYLLPNEYGLLSIIQIFIVLTVPLISVNIVATVRIEYSRLGHDELAQLISAVLLIPVFSLILFSLVFLIAEPAIRRFIDIPLFWIVLIPVVAFFHVIPNLVLALYQMSERPVKYGQFQVLLAAVNLAISIVLVVQMHWNWEGRIVAILLSYVLFTIIGIYTLRNMGLLTSVIDKKYIAEALKVGAPLIVHVVSATLFMMSDRLFISYYLGNESVGVYAVGAQIAMIAGLIQQSFNQAWVPYLYRHLSTNQITDKIKIVKISYVALLFFLLLPFMIDIMSGPLFAILVDDKYEESIKFVFWVALGYSFLGMYKVVTGYIFYEKKTHILALMTFISLVINIVLNYFFIHAYGAIGVAYATALTIGIFFIMAAVIASAVHPMPWFWFLSRQQ
jgi:O-antigen/teichoic acid export membrane protein